MSQDQLPTEHDPAREADVLPPLHFGRLDDIDPDVPHGPPVPTKAPIPMHTEEVAISPAVHRVIRTRASGIMTWSAHLMVGMGLMGLAFLGMAWLSNAPVPFWVYAVIIAVTVGMEALFAYYLRQLRRDQRELGVLRTTGEIRYAYHSSLNFPDYMDIWVGDVHFTSQNGEIFHAIRQLKGQAGTIDYTRRAKEILEIRDADGTVWYGLDGYLTPQEEAAARHLPPLDFRPFENRQQPARHDETRGARDQR